MEIKKATEAASILSKIERTIGIMQMVNRIIQNDVRKGIHRDDLDAIINNIGNDEEIFKQIHQVFKNRYEGLRKQLEEL